MYVMVATYRQFYLGALRADLQTTKTIKHVTKWNWQKWSSKLNYGYPISLDGHIFRTKELCDLSHKFKFDYIIQSLAAT